MSKKCVMISGVGWNDNFQRHQKFANFISDDCDVIYLQGVVASGFKFDKIFGYVNKILGTKKKETNKRISNEKNSNVKVVSVFTLPSTNLIFRNINKILVNKYSKKIGKVDYLINYLPIDTSTEFVKKLKPTKVIYDCVRNFSAWPQYPNDIDKQEDQFTQLCDEVWVDSFYLKNKFTNGYNIPVKQILPTYDERIFKRISVKDKIENFVYYGLVSNKLDIPLLTKIAKKYNLYIAGPIEKGCELPEGAHYLGCFEQKELFEKVSEIADAFIIPYVGKNMEGVIPAKTTELMAMGLPVYISSFYDSRELSDIFYVYNNHDEIFNYIDGYSIEDFNIRANKGLVFSEENKDTMLKSKVTLN